MKNKKIAIIGGGYVGLHTALKLISVNPEYEITILDVDKNKIEKWNKGMSPIDDYFMNKFINDNPHKLKNIKYITNDYSWVDYDIFFISLSTNPIDGKENELNTASIFKIADDIKLVKENASIVIRSTINVSDSSKCLDKNICYWPEFLSQGIETAINLERLSNVVFIPKTDNFANIFFDDFFYGKQIIKSSPQEAIMVKIMHNTLDAYLISITNLFANLSEENNINFNIVSSAVEELLKNRSKVKKPGIGFGGSCYPKDSYSLISVTESEQNKKLIQAMEDFNNQQSFSFLYKKDLIYNAKNILVLGVSFKGGTNDITRTPTTSLRSWLLSNGINYKIWEPMINEKWLLKNETISQNVVEDIQNSDLVIVASDWNEFNTLLKNYKNIVIDLKYCIEENGMMDLHYIGNRKNKI